MLFLIPLSFRILSLLFFSELSEDRIYLGCVCVRARACVCTYVCVYLLEIYYFSKVKHNLKQEVVFAEALIGQPAVIPGQHHQCDRLQVPTAARARLIILSHGFLHPAEREPHSQKSRRNKEAFLMLWSHKLPTETAPPPLLKADLAA